MSVFRRVVGVRRDALERLRAGLETRPSGLRLVAAVGLEFPEPSGLAVVVVGKAVVTTVASEITRSPPGVLVPPPPNMGDGVR